MNKLSLENLADYFAGALPAEEEHALEEALFDESVDPTEADRLAEILAEMRRFARRGAFNPVITPDAAFRLAERGIRLLEVGFEPDGRMRGWEAFEERVERKDFDVLVTRLPAGDLSAVRRVDLECFITKDRIPTKPMEDVPFDPASGEIVMACDLSLVEKLREVYRDGITYRIVAVDEKGGRRLLAEHSATRDGRSSA